ncbi:hypothetical protein EGW08_016333 [Elysia chlorotica]|uniref:Apple domain-containing protein n=1 Tax=Elysia chlorotica TaxID=188477 RepID=A0A433T326_ELYCH|nr:hypothetical protein EGW08_016333 [Elysia chlorotica]
MPRTSSCRVVYLATLHTLTLLLLLVNPKNVQAAFCTKGSARAPITLIRITKSSFSAEIFRVDVKAREATRVHEHYSQRFKTSAVYIIDDVMNAQFQIYNRKTNTGVSNLGGGACREDNTEPTIGLMRWMVSRMPPVSYVGTEDVAGETLHNWRACREDDDFEYQEDLYTTGPARQWGSPSGGDYVPVKMVVKKMNKKTSERSQVNDYFLQFVARDDNDPDFQDDLNPPIGSSCDIGASMKMPVLPESIIYTSEPTDMPQKPITYILDSEKQLVITKGEAADSTDQYRDVDSYKLGVNFKMPSDQGESCGMSSYAVLGDRELQRSISYADSYSTDPFESVRHFLGISDGFTYNGEHTVRGIPCMVFTKFYEDYRGTGETTVILYFTTPQVKISSSVGGKSSIPSVLIKKDVWKGGKVIYEHNIYNLGILDYSRLDYDPLDISDCKADMGEVAFTLLFAIGDQYDIKHAKNFHDLEVLKGDLRAELAKTAGVDELRVQITDLLFQRGKFMAQVRLLGPLTRQAYITQVAGSIPDMATYPDKYVTRYYYSLDFCQQRAVGRDEVNFVSYCESTQVCLVYQDVEPSDLTIDDDCTGYFIGNNRADPVELKDAWSKITDAVDSGLFQVDGYKASKVAKFDPSAEHNQTIPSIQMYEKIPGSTIEQAISTDKYSSLLDCTNDCTNSFNFECEAFTYCEADQTCKLNPSPNNQWGVYVERNPRCDVYVRKYLSDFTALETTSVAIDTEMVFEKVEDPDLCARLCVNLNDFRCESFDFCALDDGGGSGTCSLFRKHYFDVAESSSTVILPHTKCTHYSRNYLGDYDRKDGLTSLPLLTQTRKSSPDSCAKACSSQDTSGESRCTIFHFCQVGGECQFVDESSFTGEASRRLPELTEAAGCATYSLKRDVFQIHGRSNALRAKARQALSSMLGGAGAGGGEYGAGSMAGLALVMLALGAALFLLAMFVWTRHQRGQGFSCFSTGGGAGKEMSIEFSKEQLDVVNA